MTLADLDRPPVTHHYAPWGREVTMRPISARDLVTLQSRWADLEGERADSDRAVSFYAELLAATVTDPAADPNTWATETTQRTLLDLGQVALELCGLAHHETKKN
jgi:hypothetical protein